MTAETILVVNAGSSSIKFQLFEVGAHDRLKRRFKGQIEGIGTLPAARAQRAKSVLYREISRGWLKCHVWRGKKCIAEADAIAWLSPQAVEPEPPAPNAGIPATVEGTTNG